MKIKSFITMMFAAVAVVFGMSACSSDDIKMERGVISEMTDSTMMADIDGSALSLDITKALYPNGAVQQGDSVIINYRGETALSLTLIPQQGRIVIVGPEPDESKELLTRPAENVDKKEQEKTREVFRKYGK